MHKNKKCLLVFGTLFLIFGILPLTVQAAMFYFSPSSGNYEQGENFTIGVLVNAEKSVNAVGGVLNFSTDNLAVIALGTSNSVVNLWVQQPSFSNAGATGNVSFEGVILNPGFTGAAGKIINVVFTVKKSGSATLIFKELSILANDGLATNIATSPGSAFFTFIESQTPQEKEADWSLENKIKEVEKMVNALQNPEGPDVIIKLWQILPGWIQISILALVGIASIILLFATLSFGIIILIWIWSSIWYYRRDFTRLLKYVFLNVKILLGKTLIALRLAEKEFVNDVYYAIEELKKDLKEAKKHPSFSKITKDYWFSILRIIKRFFTKNAANGLSRTEKEEKTEKE